MQPQGASTTVETNPKPSEVWMHTLPEELVGVLPQGVWGGISLDQKKEVLRQHGLLEKYTQVVAEELPAIEAVSAEIVSTPTEEVQTTPEVVKKDEVTMPEESEKFSAALERIKELEKDTKEEVLTAEQQQRVDVENASSANVQSNPIKVFGYGLPGSIANNAKAIADNNSVVDGSTWAATLAKKIFAIFD